MARLVLMCGIAGSGKSTYARNLEVSGWLRLSIDRVAWDRGYTVHPLPPDVSDDIREKQRGELVRALQAGRNVVVDYSFWSRDQRDVYRRLGRENGAEVEVVYLDVSRAEVLRRLADRGGRGADDIRLAPEVVDSYVSGFEVPTADETDVRTIVPSR